ncbi:hypothetical protein IAI10_10770 [Clostridium sp. 19966]|uniref:hypothetical protein n=1 Tax=Clostridium sp. 19966 TaxID=2768166 RepID=UPI0028DE2DDD|nr:hypothetical protein [Clostridium sp. 19966]MDT8717138.1 hypothetical protein [Clostridium sp. 19966]
MRLIITTLLFGLLGTYGGLALGGSQLGILMGLLGIVSPALFVLDKLYKNSNDKTEIDLLLSLDNLKASEILTDEEYDNFYSTLIKKKEAKDNKSKYDVGVDVLYELAQANAISEEEYRKKIQALKTLYNHN